MSQISEENGFIPASSSIGSRWPSLRVVPHVPIPEEATPNTQVLLDLLTLEHFRRTGYLQNGTITSH